LQALASKELGEQLALPGSDPLLRARQLSLQRSETPLLLYQLRQRQGCVLGQRLRRRRVVQLSGVSAERPLHRRQLSVGALARTPHAHAAQAAARRQRASARRGAGAGARA
jgi:hypothetical protein